MSSHSMFSDLAWVRMHFRPAATHLLAFSWSTLWMLCSIRLWLSTLTPLISLYRSSFLYSPLSSEK